VHDKQITIATGARFCRGLDVPSLPATSLLLRACQKRIETDTIVKSSAKLACNHIHLNVVLRYSKDWQIVDALRKKLKEFGGKPCK
jgi:hypothetical protein